MKIGNYFLRNLLLVTLSFGQMGASGKSKLLPPTGKDVQKLRYLSGLEDVLPRIFDQPPPFDFDILGVLDDQDKVVSELQKSSKYRNHPDRTLLQFYIEQGANIKVDPVAVSTWKQGLKESLSHLNSKEAVSDQLQRKLSVLSSQLGQGNSQGLRTGLINSLPKDERAQYFKMDVQTQFQKLSESLPSDLSASGFKGEAYGLPGNGVTREQALDLLSAKLKTEKQFNQLLQLKIALQESSQPNPRSLAEARSALDQISPERIIALGNKKDLETAVSAAGLGGQKNPAWFAELDRSMKSLSKSGETIPLISKGIRITELPPTVGLFRGYLGGDCSTKLSCGYVWGPDERTFLISGEDGARKGYVSGVILKAGGKKSFYVHTINGSKISTAETRAVFQGLNQVSKQMGVSQVVIATKTMSATTNYPEIQAGFRAETSIQPEVELKYQDSYARRKIDPFMTGTYDRVGANTVGSVFVNDPAYTPLKTTLEKNPIVFNPKPITRDRAFLLAIDFKNVGQEAVADRVISAMGKSPKKFNQTIEILRNPKHLPTAEYLKELHQRFQSWNLTLDEDLLLKKKTWFSVGLMNASDSMSAENQKRTIGGVFDTFSGLYAADEKVQSFVETHREALKADPRLWPQIKKWASESNAQLKTFSEKMGMEAEIAANVRIWFDEAENNVIKSKLLSTAASLGSKDIVPLLAENIDHAAPEIRATAQVYLQNLLSAHQDQFTEKFHKLLNGPDQTIAAEIAKLMGYSNLYGDDPELKKGLLKILRNPQAPLINDAATIMTYYIDLHNDPKALNYIREFAESPVEVVRRMAAYQVGKLPEIKASPKLYFEFEKLLFDPDELVRSNMFSSFPAIELPDFISRHQDMKPLVNLISKISSSHGHLDDRLVPLVTAALEQPTSQYQAMNALRGFRELPPEVDKKLRTFIVPESPLFQNALFALEARLSLAEERKIMSWLGSGNDTVTSSLTQWIISTQYKFQDPESFQKILKYVFNPKTKNQYAVTSLMSFLVSSGPSEEVKEKVFRAGLADTSNSGRRETVIRAWAGKPEFPEFGRKEVASLMHSSENFPYDVFFNKESFWKDSEMLRGAWNGLDRVTESSAPSLFFSLLQSNEAPRSQIAEQMVIKVFDRMEPSTRISYVGYIAQYAESYQMAPDRLRVFAIDAELRAKDKALKAALTPLVQSLSFDVPGEMEPLVQKLVEAKRLNLLSMIFEKKPASPEVAEALLHALPAKSKGSDWVWKILSETSNPYDAKLQMAIAELMAKSSPASSIRKNGLKFFAVHPPHTPEVRSVLDRVSENPTAKIAVPANCHQQVMNVLKSI